MPDPTRRMAADSTFAELVCADPAWLRAEFDAIIAASFPTVPPPRDEAPSQGSPDRAAGPAPGFPDHVARPRPLVRVRERWMRQRSPPAATPHRLDHDRLDHARERKAGDVGTRTEIPG